MAKMDGDITSPASQAQLLPFPNQIGEKKTSAKDDADNRSNQSSESDEVGYISSEQQMLPNSDESVGVDMEVELKRGNWSGRFDFLMSLLGYSVGLGNVWRFPYLAYSNGGGAFLIPFLIMLFLVGMPLMFLELAFGQYASLGPIAIYEQFCPLFHGLGCGMVIVSGTVCLYYNVILSWTIFYLIASLNSALPWETCHPEWSTPKCYSFKDADECAKINGSVYTGGVCYNETMVDRYNLTSINLTTTNVSAPAQDYFNNYVLGITDDITDMGTIRWKLALCLLAAWTIVCFCLSKGVKSSGKVVYFTALFPYVVLIILFIRGVTLDGAKEGIIFYLTPQWELLGQAKVWVAAAVQIFFSLSPAWGGLITLASYNKFDNNCLKDSLIVSIGNISTSIFAGFVIFAIIGYLAKELGQPVNKVIEHGAGLAFIVYPEVVTRLPISPLWSVLFFVMLLTLGLGSQFAILETVLTAIYDRFPVVRKRKYFVVGGVCLLGFLGGLAMTAEGGMYVLQLLDTYAASYSVFFMAMTESLVIGWVYGSGRFCKNVEEMIGAQGPIFHIIMFIFWRFLSPATLLFLLIFNLVQYEGIEYAEKPYPNYANVIGWMFAIAPIAFIFIVGIHKFYTTNVPHLTFVAKVRHLLKPTADWRPAHKYEVSPVSVQVIDDTNNKSFNVVYEDTAKV